MRYNYCKEIHLFRLELTESPSALNWTERSVSNWRGVVIPETFEEVESIPLETLQISFVSGQRFH